MLGVTCGALTDLGPPQLQLLHEPRKADCNSYMTSVCSMNACLCHPGNPGRLLCIPLTNKPTRLPPLLRCALLFLLLSSCLQQLAHLHAAGVHA
jgi:hypothetical protein